MNSVPHYKYKENEDISRYKEYQLTVLPRLICTMENHKHEFDSESTVMIDLPLSVKSLEPNDHLDCVMRS